MPTFQTLAVLGCIGAIGVGAAALGMARVDSSDDLSSPAAFNAAAEKINQIEPITQVDQRADESEPRGSLYYWRATNARRAGRTEQGEFIMPNRQTPAVSDERLAYERELFSREVKNNMLVPSAALAGVKPEGKVVADAKVSGGKADAMAQALEVGSLDASSATPQKPKKKRIARPRRDAPMMAFDMRFDRPFGAW
jgi:hypothetical protein